MAITCSEERRQRWTNQLKGRKEKLTEKKKKKLYIYKETFRK
jgi:hypothetical protein